MLFNSTIFILVFLPLTVSAYYVLAERPRARLALLCFASLVFYGYWDLRFLPLLAGSVVANWLLVRLYVRRPLGMVVVSGIVLNLVLLGVFKYADFFAGSLSQLTGQSFDRFNVILPLGISFFTFQQLSYLIDLKQNRARAYGFLEYFLYVTFFAQLVAGPIVRHNELIPQFRLAPIRPETARNLSCGAVLFLIGLFKKVVLADSLAPLADPVFAAATDGQTIAFADSWVAAIAFSLQIYFDFSGYSDMAIGIALLFGFALPINFDVPYRACSIREFWRRWHITLSRFLRDYLYIPLGGNRLGQIRQAVNLLITMLLGGLWHGAAWTFVVWGGLHGLALAVNHLWDRLGAPLPRLAGWALTMLFLIFTWVLFRAEGFGAAADMMAAMLGASGTVGAVPDSESFWLLAVAAVVAVVGPSSQRAVEHYLLPRRYLAVAIGVSAAVLLLWIGGTPHQEFIYFQF